MTEMPVVQRDAQIEDAWFAEGERPSSPPPAPAAADAELDSDWFARGRPLSSRPPPPVDVES